MFFQRMAVYRVVIEILSGEKGCKYGPTDSQ